MKKFLALLLAAMMLLCCTTAFAAEGEGTTTPSTFDSIVNGSKYTDGYDSDEGSVYEDGDATMSETGVSVRYTDGQNTFAKSGQAATEMWLQVDATGQIDVTVPLVLVFKTNIDGGDATSPEAYKITNHSTADLVVTELATTKVAYSETAQPMEMVAWSNTLTEDQYAVRIRPASGVVLGSDKKAEYDMYTSDADTKTLHAQNAYNGGLFELKKAPKDNNETGTVTNLNVDMKTGRLSFVTHHKANDQLDTDKGIHLMTITYTVAIDQSDAYGDDITTKANMTEADRILDATNANDTTTAGVRIDEIKVSSATENNANDNDKNKF